MSGMIAVINLDGTPVDSALLARMVNDIAYRGPDAQQTWVEGNLGFGFSLFREAHESEFEQQPLTIEDVTIIANARLDARDELIQRLRSSGRDVSREMPDVNLVCTAYLV